MVKKGISEIQKSEDFSEILLYTIPKGNLKAEIYLKDEPVWLTQQKIADLLRVQRPSITKLLKHIFDTGELREEAVCSKIYLTTADGKSYSAEQTALCNHRTDRSRNSCSKGG